MTFEEFKTLLERDRTVRRYDHSRAVSRATLEKLVELTRFCSSGRNAQPLKYRIVTDNAECESVFGALKWAGYFTWWDGPAEEERPAAYLIQCLDTRYGENCLCDDGLQLQAITLGATALGLSGCIIKAFNPTQVSQALGIGERFKPRYVLALGYAAEKVEIEDMPSGDDDGDFKYYRSSDGTHHVPKRMLSDLIL